LNKVKLRSHYNGQEPRRPLSNLFPRPSVRNLYSLLFSGPVRAFLMARGHFQRGTVHHAEVVIR
jgi:hypothetical protein